jgi:hypothetical protein
MQVRLGEPVAARAAHIADVVRVALAATVATGGLLERAVAVVGVRGEQPRRRLAHLAQPIAVIVVVVDGAAGTVGDAGQTPVVHSPELPREGQPDRVAVDPCDEQPVGVEVADVAILAGQGPGDRVRVDAAFEAEPVRVALVLDARRIARDLSKP